MRTTAYARFAIAPLICLILVSSAANAFSQGHAAESSATTTVVSSIRASWSFEKAVDAADAIVVGTVKGIGAPVLSNEAPGVPGEPSLGRAVSAPVTLSVTEVLNGSVQAGDLITLAQLGGQIGQFTCTFEDETEFLVGEQVLVYLYKPTGAYAVWTGGAFHASQGKYVIGGTGQAYNAYRNETMPVQTLKDRIQEVLRKR